MRSAGGVFGGRFLPPIVDLSAFCLRLMSSFVASRMGGVLPLRLFYSGGYEVVKRMVPSGGGLLVIGYIRRPHE